MKNLFQVETRKKFLKDMYIGKFVSYKALLDTTLLNTGDPNSGYRRSIRVAQGNDTSTEGSKRNDSDSIISFISDEDIIKTCSICPH